MDEPETMQPVCHAMYDKLPDEWGAQSSKEEYKRGSVRVRSNTACRTINMSCYNLALLTSLTVAGAMIQGRQAGSGPLLAVRLSVSLQAFGPSCSCSFSNMLGWGSGVT